MNAAKPAVTVELYFVPDKPAGRRWEAVIPGVMGCGGSPLVALIDLAQKLEKEQP